jgi:hypothetical protein
LRFFLKQKKPVFLQFFWQKNSHVPNDNCLLMGGWKVKVALRGI